MQPHFLSILRQTMRNPSTSCEKSSRTIHIKTLLPIKFTTDTHRYNTYWNVEMDCLHLLLPVAPKHGIHYRRHRFRSRSPRRSTYRCAQSVVQSDYADSVMWGHCWMEMYIYRIPRCQHARRCAKICPIHAHADRFGHHQI